MSNARLWTRREWMHVTALSVAAGSVGLGAVARRPLGVQLYTVRDLLPQRAPETLKAIAGMGYEEVEIVRADAERIVKLARDVGLRPVSMHIESGFVSGNWAPMREMAKRFNQPFPEPPSFDALVEQVKGLGLSYMVVAWLPPGERGKDSAAWKLLADQLNAAGAKAKKAGIQLGYHNHEFEFEKLSDGGSGMEIFVARLDPALVKLEIDVFWTAVAGVDPAAFVTRLGNRVELLHVKDRKKGVEDPMKAFAEVGSGALDFKAILAAADTAGVTHAFVEQDVSPDPVASLEESAKYLRSMA